MHRYAPLFMLVPLLLLSSCAQTPRESRWREAFSHDPQRSIYVVQRGWHTGIAIAAADWPNRNWALLPDFPDVEYLEFGWGDEQYYQAERNTVWLSIRAVLWPTSSVIHVIGLHEPVLARAQADDVVHLRISAHRLREITETIEQEFSGRIPRATGRTLALAPTPNRFYEARRKFYFPRMCNWWIAARLQQAYCPVKAWTVITAPRVMKEARECAARSLHTQEHPAREP